jgi:hypothetical protein
VFIYLLLSISIGVEGGYNLPATGFDNLKSGPIMTIFLSRDIGIVDITTSLETSFYFGKNPAYSMNRYGFHIGFSKRNWQFSPVIEIGGDYVSRGINNVSESGFAMNYGLGFLINFRVEKLRIYPKLYYDGLTDFKSHAGFIGIKLGIDYEI